MTTPPASTPRRPRVLFVCAHNAGRSVLAVALARHHAADRIEADSAGTTPDDGPSASTTATLAELGIDASGHRPSAVTADRVAAADVVVAMKPGLELPHVDGVRYETWHLPDPAGWDTEGIRPLRRQIDARVQALVADLVGTAPTTTDAGTTPSDGTGPDLGRTP
ncbi:arsenate-mycothiol transferase ArsC [Geodermatophilus sp. SYSU D00710]